MTNITINSRKHTIEMSKKLAAEASKYGTEAYNDLQNVRRDYPNYKVVIIRTKARKDSFKGLTYEYMEKYIQAHDDKKENFTEYENLRGKSKEARESAAETLSYGEIKKWFLDRYPEVREFYKTRASILSRAETTV